MDTEQPSRRQIVEAAVRHAVRAGDVLPTPTGRGQFTVAELRPDGFVLLLGPKEARTALPWASVETVPNLLRGRGWVPLGSTYDVDGTPGTLDAHLRGYLKRATAGWVAVVMERAGVVDIDRSRPAQVRLRPGW